MKIKVSKAVWAQLDWLVAKCEGKEVWVFPSGYVQALYKDAKHPDGRWAAFCPSTDWYLGGQIIEREKIAVSWDDMAKKWIAMGNGAPVWGSTLLIAAMRCFCAGKLEEEIDIPEELM